MDRYPEALPQWETLEEEEEEEEEALSRSMSPTDRATHDFEFWISEGGGLLPTTAGATMCSADEVFFQGRILPLRPSAGTGDCASAVVGRGAGRCFSQPNCVDLCFAANRSNSSGSVSVSRSHSSSSAHSVNALDPPPLSKVSGHFQTHPSPKPCLRGARRRSTGRRSTSSAPGAGWGIFRLGVVGAPEIELHDLKSRRITKSGSGFGGQRPSDADASHANHKAAATSRLIVGLGLSCKCSPAAAEPIPPEAKVRAGRKKEEGVRLRRESSVSRSRIIGWLEELSIAKVTGRHRMLGFCSGL